VEEDTQTIGQRLRALRLWRRLTLAELAGLCGVTAPAISMWENGRRPLDRRSHISALAAALRVSETELTGGPHSGTDPLQSAPHTAIPALRIALQTNSLSSPAVDRARPVAELAEEVSQHIEPLHRRSDYVEIGVRLPAVIDALHLHICEPADEAAQILALETLVEACVTAAFTAKHLGYPDLAHLAAVRAEEAARLLGDPVQQGKAAFLRIQTSPRAWDRTLPAAERAATALEPHARTPLAMQVLGLLTLSAAMAAAAVQRGDTAESWLGEADRLAAHVPDDMWGNWQSFSATNVALWRTAIGVERGESGGRVLALASAVKDGQVTVGSRKADFLVDVGRGLARDPKTRPEAVHWLHRAEESAPQRVRNSAPAREAVAYLLSRATATAGGRELRGMAARMGVAH